MPTYAVQKTFMRTAKPCILFSQPTVGCLLRRSVKPWTQESTLLQTDTASPAFRTPWPKALTGAGYVCLKLACQSQTSSFSSIPNRLLRRHETALAVKFSSKRISKRAFMNACMNSSTKPIGRYFMFVNL